MAPPLAARYRREADAYGPDGTAGKGGAMGVSAAWEVVDLWVGRFGSAEAADAYFEETYSDDEDEQGRVIERPISPFAADMGATFYDHDFLEREYHDPPLADLAAALARHSFATSYVAQAVAAAGPDLQTPFDLVLLVFGREIEKPVSVKAPTYSLAYVGRFACDPNVPYAG